MSKATIIATKHGDCALSYSSKRKTLAISVLPDGELEVVAPIATSESEILSKLEKRAYWIFKQRLYFSNLNTKEKKLRYVSGATHRYLGKQYRLKIELSEESSVKLKGGFFLIFSTCVGEREIESLLEAWYRKQATKQLENRIKKWVHWCEVRNLPRPKVALRKMQKRWGSAHHSGIIYFNPDLIKTPSVCVDYVMIHEICHLSHPNHGELFYTLLESLCPSWRLLRMRLGQL